MNQTIKRVAVIEGEDASPEAVKPVVKLIDDLGLGIEWVYPPVGGKGEKEFGSVFPDKAKEMIDGSDTTLFGSSSGKSFLALFYLRWGRKTYANVRPVKYIDGYKSPLADPSGIDMVIVRENMEDLYVGVEGDINTLGPANLTSSILQKKITELGEGKFAVKIITRENSERIARFAFELARRRKGEGRPGKVTASSKYNMLPQSDGLFIAVAAEVAKSYPDIAFETMIIDNMAHQLVVAPKKMDVVLLPNLYGDILSDETAGLIGGLGLAPSGCYADDYAYFESAHGTAPDIAGKNIINPTATLLSATMMLEYLGFADVAKALNRSMEKVYKQAKYLTPDQGGSSQTTDFIKAVRDNI